MKLELTEDELKKILLSLKQSLMTMRDDHSKVSYISEISIGLVGSWLRWSVILSGNPSNQE